MKAHSRCPKCNGTKLFVCDNIQPDHDSSNTVHALVITTPEISNEDVGAKLGTRYRTHDGSYETWICAGCGYTEWYAKDPEHLRERLANTPRSGVRVVDKTAATPPYR